MSRLTWSLARIGVYMSAAALTGYVTMAAGGVIANFSFIIVMMVILPLSFVLRVLSPRPPKQEPSQ